MMANASMYRTIVAVAVSALCLAAASIGAPAQTVSAPQLANPASVNCTQKGGMLQIERRPDGGQYGVCVFADDYQCEEWALFRGECPVGGRRVTGYITPAGRYCTITGGRYIAVSGGSTADEKGTCTRPDGKVCDADGWYAGTC